MGQFKKIKYLLLLINLFKQKEVVFLHAKNANKNLDSSVPQIRESISNSRKNK